MKKLSQRHGLEGLAALLLFAVFAVCVLMVLLTGADAYRRLTRRDREAFDRRTGVQYMAARVRQADADGALAVEDLEGVQALVLGKGQDYVTWVYCYEGNLMELYAAEGAGLGPEDGEKVMELGGMDVSIEDGVLSLEVTDAGGNQDSLLFALQSGKECGSP